MCIQPLCRRCSGFFSGKVPPEQPEINDKIFFQSYCHMRFFML